MKRSFRAPLFRIREVHRRNPPHCPHLTKTHRRKQPARSCTSLKYGSKIRHAASTLARFSHDFRRAPFSAVLYSLPPSPYHSSPPHPPSSQQLCLSPHVIAAPYPCPHSLPPRPPPNHPRLTSAAHPPHKKCGFGIDKSGAVRYNYFKIEPFKFEHSARCKPLNPSIEFSRKLGAAYDASCKPLCRELGIPQTALDILMFLANNPSYRTAAQIVSIRKLKANLVRST